MNIYESAEDYLERILILQEKNEGVRSIDIAHSMGFSKPSVSVAMNKLKEQGITDLENIDSVLETMKNELDSKYTELLNQVNHYEELYKTL